MPHTPSNVAHLLFQTPSKNRIFTSQDHIPTEPPTDSATPPYKTAPHLQGKGLFPVSFLHWAQAPLPVPPTPPFSPETVCEAQQGSPLKPPVGEFAGLTCRAREDARVQAAHR